MSSTEPMSADTTPEVDRLYRSLLMSRSGAERLRMGAGMFDAARALVAARVRADRGEMSESELRAAVFVRVYANDLDEGLRSAVVARVRRDR